MASITSQEVYNYHRMERELYVWLVCAVHRDAFQSLLVMALWLWLEHIGNRNLIFKIRSLSANLITSLANEAVLCLHFMEAEEHVVPHVPPGGGLPLTAIVTNSPISLHLFIQRRFTVIAGIKSVLDNLCSRMFQDILCQFFGSSEIVPGMRRRRVEEWDLREQRLWLWKPWEETTEEDRTMFLTFSRGFPVTEDEVAFVFRGIYGDNTVLHIYMMQPLSDEAQCLYATMVVDSVATVDRILAGKRISKFRINGKHIWARKYQPRNSPN